MEILFIFNVRTLTDALHTTREKLEDYYGYKDGDMAKCVGVLVSMGIVWHMATLAAICFANRDKRK
jgi:hypothetical protein